MKLSKAIFESNIPEKLREATRRKAVYYSKGNKKKQTTIPELQQKSDKTQLQQRQQQRQAYWDKEREQRQ